MSNSTANFEGLYAQTRKLITVLCSGQTKQIQVNESDTVTLIGQSISMFCNDVTMQLKFTDKLYPVSRGCMSASFLTANYQISSSVQNQTRLPVKKCLIQPETANILCVCRHKIKCNKRWMNHLLLDLPNMNNQTIAKLMEHDNQPKQQQNDQSAEEIIIPIQYDRAAESHTLDGFTSDQLRLSENYALSTQTGGKSTDAMIIPPFLLFQMSTQTQPVTVMVEKSNL